jgi:hypothetical protein
VVMKIMIWTKMIEVYNILHRWRMGVGLDLDIKGIPKIGAEFLRAEVVIFR